MSINLKYSDNLDRDYKKLSKGRKNYIKKMAGKQKLTISNYLNLKYGEIENETEWTNKKYFKKLFDY